MADYVAARQIRLSVAAEQPAPGSVPALLAVFLVAAGHQRDDEDDARQQEDDSADEVEHIAACDRRGDEEPGAHHKQQPAPQVESLFTTAVRHVHSPATWRML